MGSSSKHYWDKRLARQPAPAASIDEFVVELNRRLSDDPATPSGVTFAATALPGRPMIVTWRGPPEAGRLIRRIFLAASQDLPAPFPLQAEPQDAD